MPEAVGSTFGGGAFGGLVVVVLYLVLGPGAVIFHARRWALHRYSVASRNIALLGWNELQTVKQCLPWNIGITLIPALPTVFDMFRR